MSRTGFWVDSQRVLHSYTNDAPFCLTPCGKVFLNLLEPPGTGNLLVQESSLFSVLHSPRVEVVDWADAARVGGVWWV